MLTVTRGVTRLKINFSVLARRLCGRADGGADVQTFPGHDEVPKIHGKVDPELWRALHVAVCRADPHVHQVLAQLSGLHSRHWPPRRLQYGGIFHSERRTPDRNPVHERAASKRGIRERYQVLQEPRGVQNRGEQHVPELGDKKVRLRATNLPPQVLARELGQK